MFLFYVLDLRKALHQLFQKRMFLRLCKAPNQAMQNLSRRLYNEYRIYPRMILIQKFPDNKLLHLCIRCIGKWLNIS